jgi:hypothetical protein
VSCSRATRSRLLAYIVLASAFLLAAVSSSFAQDSGTQNIGLPVGSTFSGSDFDTVSLANGNLHVEIPLYSVGGRGLSVPVSFVYDTKGWAERTTASANDGLITVYLRTNQLSWVFAAPLANGLGMHDSRSGPQGCLTPSGTVINITVANNVYREPNGTAHPFPPVGPPGNACGFYSPSSVLASDGSGYMLLLDPNPSFPPLKVIAKDGTSLYWTHDAQNNVNGAVHGRQ